MRPRVALGVVFLIGIAIRLPFIWIDPHVIGDTALITGWAHHLADGGMSGLLAATGQMVLYPPLSLLMLWFAGAAGPALELTKCGAMLADLAIGALVAFHLAEHPARVQVAIVAAIVLNPALWYLSAVWGQIDSVFVFCTVASVIALERQHVVLSWAAWGAAVAAKLQAIVVAPVLVVRTLRVHRTAGLLRGGATWLAAVALAGVLLVAAAGWDVGYLGRLWHTESDLDITAFNAWYVAEAGIKWLRPTLLGRLDGGLGTVIGLLALAMVMAVVSVAIWRRPERVGVALPAATMVLGTFVLLTAMRERYLIAAIPLVAIVAAGDPRRGPDRSAVFALVALTASQMLNLVAVASFAPGLWINVFIDLPEWPLGPLAPAITTLGYVAALANVGVLTWALARQAAQVRASS